MAETEVNGLTNGHNEEIAPKKFEIPTATLKEVKVTEYMRECLDKVALAEGFVNYEINVIHGSAVGDGFVGLIFKVNIEEKESDKKLSVILKSPPEGARRTDFKAMSLFEREVFLYSEVLPQFVNLQEEKKIKKSAGFFNFPKCYYAEFIQDRDESVIIMEDLRDSGYKMCDKFKPTNYEHTKLVMTALGRLHALSFALKARRPEIFAKYKELDDFMTKNLDEPFFVQMLEGSLERAIGTLPENDLKRRNKVLKLKENVKDFIKDLGSSVNA